MRKFRHGLAKNVDALGLQALQVAEPPVGKQIAGNLLCRVWHVPSFPFVPPDQPGPTATNPPAPFFWRWVSRTLCLDSGYLLVHLTSPVAEAGQHAHPPA